MEKTDNAPVIKFNGNIITELEAVKKISEGETLDRFSVEYRNREGNIVITNATKLMSFAAATYHKKAYREILNENWSKSLVKLCMKNDYRTVTVVPEMFLSSCVERFTLKEGTFTRNDKDGIDEYKKIFNSMPEDFVNACLKVKPSLIRYLDNAGEKSKRVADGNRVKPHIKNSVLPDPSVPDGFRKNIVSDDKIPHYDGNDFLRLPASAKTEQMLKTIIMSDKFLDPSFIKDLTVPQRNAFFYKKHGDEKRAAYWNSQVLPYVTQDLCVHIAELHPEASIATPGLLKKDAVDRFFNRLVESERFGLIRFYFNLFPENVLDLKYMQYITPDLDVICHAPHLLQGTEYSYRYFTRHPYDILNVPGVYQTANLLLRDGVKLNSHTIKKIEDHDLRNIVALALNIKIPEA